MEGLPGVAWQKTALAAPSDIQAVPETLTSNSMQVGWTEVDKAESYVLDISPKVSRFTEKFGESVDQSETCIFRFNVKMDQFIKLRQRSVV